MASSTSDSSHGSEPRYSLDAAQAIFRRPAERQETARAAREAGADGLTLAELQDIGAETGVDPAHIAAAAAEFEAPESDDETPWWFSGGPPEVSVHRVVPVSIRDGPVWEAMVDELRSALDADGIATPVGSTLEWSATSQVNPIRVTVALEAHGTRIEIAQSRRDEAAAPSLLGGSFLAMSILFAGLAVVGAESGLWAIVITFATIALLGFAVSAPLYRRRAHRKQRRFERVLDRLELIALKEGDVTAEASAEHASIGREERIGEDVLDEAFGDDERSDRSRDASPGRRSTRS